jgi:hypothetical protein
MLFPEQAGNSGFWCSSEFDFDALARGWLTLVSLIHT